MLKVDSQQPGYIARHGGDEALTQSHTFADIGRPDPGSGDRIDNRVCC